MKMLGNGRLEASCMDGVKRLGNIRGSKSTQLLSMITTSMGQARVGH